MNRLRVAVSADVGHLPRSVDHVAVRFVLGLLGLIGVGQLCAGCESPALDVAELPAVDVRVEAVAVVVPPKPARAEVVEPPGWRPGPLDLPDTCDRLTVRVTPEGPVFGKIISPWVKVDAEREREQARLRALVRMIGDEFGMGPVESEMLWRIAIREGSGNTNSVHVHGPDVAANEASSHRMEDLAGAWREAPTVVYFSERGELTQAGTVDGWAIGRGTYGMNTSLFMPRWSLDAPPWALCDPIVSTIVAIWSMRASLDRCEAKTLRSVHRRSWAATCELRDPEREAQFDRLARGKVRGLELDWVFNPDQRADLGERWPEETTDRAELYALLRARAVDQGLVGR